MFASSVTLAPALRPAAPTARPKAAPVGFAPGTMIRTIYGAMPVERLMAGDLLLDADGQIVELRAVRRHRVAASDLVQIDPSAMGLGLAPGDLTRPLVLAAGQSVAISDWRTEVVFGKPALTPAQKLVDGVHVHRQAAHSRTVIALSFDKPTIVLANGLRALASAANT